MSVYMYIYIERERQRESSTWCCSMAAAAAGRPSAGGDESCGSESTASTTCSGHEPHTLRTGDEPPAPARAAERESTGYEPFAPHTQNR